MFVAQILKGPKTFFKFALAGWRTQVIFHFRFLVILPQITQRNYQVTKHQSAGLLYRYDGEFF